MKAEYEVEVEWRPFELHPEIPPEGMELPAHLRAHFRGMQERLIEMADEAGMKMVFSEWVPNSRRALEAAEYARERGHHEAFHQVVFRKFYGEGQDLGSWAVLRAAAEEVGLDPKTMQFETESGKYREIVDKHTATAQAIGIRGVPAYILDNKYAVVGAQPYEVFQQVMTRLEEESRQSN